MSSSAFQQLSSVAQLSKRFAPVVAQPDESDAPSTKFDYFAKMNIERNIELDSGSKLIIDTQSDTRFIKNYIEQNLAAIFPDLNAKGHPLVSLPSLAGYCLSLFYAHSLGCDINHREGMSFHAKTFYTDAKKKEFYNELLNSHVPDFMVELLLTFSPVYDPRRSNVLFVPTYAGYSHSHDFGRTIPPLIYYLAHHKLATTSPRKEPADYQADIYTSPIVTINSQVFRTANYFGLSNGTERHDNWVNQDFESFFNPVVGRTLVQKPTFGKMPFRPQTYAAATDLDTYEYLLNAQDENIDLALTVTRALSNFTKVTDSKAPTLGSVLASLSGSNLLNHSLEPPTIPTWSGIKIDKIDKAIIEKDPVSDTTWAKDHIHFMVTAKKYTSSHKWLTDATNLIAKLYLLKDATTDPANTPAPVELFDLKRNVTPYVLYFQPYDVSPSALTLTVTLGIKIELAEIAGFTVPTENPAGSLDDNNSMYEQSAIRMDLIKAVSHLSAATSDHVRILERELPDRTEQPIGLAIRTMCKNVFPYFNTKNVSSDLNSLPIDTEDNHDNPATAITYRAGTNGYPTLGKFAIYGWSSYRIVQKYKNPQPADISMILSFRPCYGLNVTLSRSKNPALLIPH
jgi:hypothetical protein